MKNYLLLIILLVILSCSAKKENKSYQATQIDTFQYGSYYGTSIEDVWGKYYFQTMSGKEIAWFPNDTTFYIKVGLDGINEYPLRLVSMNQNIDVKPMEYKSNSFKLVINKKIDEKDGFDAKLAILSDTSKKIYIYQRWDWMDSLKRNYKKQIFQIDTIAKENIRIK